MMIFIWMLLSVFVVAVFVLVWITVRHFSELRVLNIETDAKLQTQRKKEELILNRLSRGEGVVGRVLKSMEHVGTLIRRVGRRAVHRLKDLETHYQDLKRKSHAPQIASTEELTKALEEAYELVRQEAWVQAEKKYIEIISLDAKNVKAYEYLGRLYTKMKQFDQAEQCLRFATKLRADDASVRASLGELYLLEEQWTRALEELGKAIEKRPNNPKYLDRYVEAALMLKDRVKAQTALDQLKESNPENQKITEFEERLSSLI